MSSRRLLVLAAGLVALTAVLRLGPYLAGTRFFWHDSNSVMFQPHLIHDALRGGTLPTWTPEQNAGEPLWPVSELMVGADPVAAIVFSLAGLLGVGSPLAYQWTVALWLVSLAWGGVLCARRIHPDPLLSLAVFGVLLLGAPLTATTTMPVFLLSTRYAPWVLLAVMRFVDGPSLGRALALGVVGGVAAADYQAPYGLVFLVLFAGVYAAGTWRVTGVRPAAVLGLSAVAAGAAVPVVLPALLGALELVRDMHPVVRDVAPHGFTFRTVYFFLGLFVPWPMRNEMVGTSRLGPVLGALVAVAVVAAMVDMARWVVGRWARRRDVGTAIHHAADAAGGWSPVEVAWLTTTAAAIVIATDLGGVVTLLRGEVPLPSGRAGGATWLGLRNWGNAAGMVWLGLAQLGAAGYRRLLAWGESGVWAQRRWLLGGVALVPLALALAAWGADVAIGRPPWWTWCVFGFPAWPVCGSRGVGVIVAIGAGLVCVVLGLARLVWGRPHGPRWPSAMLGSGIIAAGLLVALGADGIGLRYGGLHDYCLVFCAERAGSGLRVAWVLGLVTGALALGALAGGLPNLPGSRRLGLVVLAGMVSYAGLTAPSYGWHGPGYARWRTEPRVTGAPPAYAGSRAWDMDIAAMAPYHLMGPAVWRQPTAQLEVDARRYGIAGRGLIKHTYHIRLKRYHALVGIGPAGTLRGDELPRYREVLGPGVSAGVLREVLGVDAPVARVVWGALPARTLREAIAYLRDVGPGPLRTWAVVEGAIPEGLRLARPWSPAPGRAVVELAHWGRGEVEYAVEVDRPGIFVYADGWTRHWRAFVDGAEVPVLIANGVGKAVVLERGGRHRVRFSYEPRLYQWAFWLRTVWWAVVLVASLTLGVRALGRWWRARATVAA